MLHLYGIIDIGSNNICLVIYEVKQSKIRSIVSTKINASLAGYINSDRRLTRKGIRKAVESINDLNHIADNFHLEQLYVFATAVLHGISNRTEALQAIEEATGLHVIVLSGAEKAVFDYYGLVNEYREKIKPANPSAENLLQNGIITDISGSSTEIVYYEGSRIVCARSLPIGSLELYNQFVNDIAPDLKEIDAMKKEIRLRLQFLNAPANVSSDILICEGGTAAGLLRVLKSLYHNQITDSMYSCEYLTRFLQLYKSDRHKCIRQILMTCPDRIHTTLPGMLILRELSRRFRCKRILTVGSGVHEGYLIHMLKVEEAQNE